MTKGQLRVLFLSVLFAGPAAGWGQEGLSLTLEEALARARRQNPDLLAARQELEIARARLVRAHYPNPFNPELGGGGAFRHFAESPGSSNDFDLTVSQELEVAGQRKKRIEEAESNLTKVAQQIKDRERLILAQVKETFYRSLFLERRLALARAIEDLNRRLREIATGRFQAGDVAKMEVNVAEVRLGQARRATIAARRDYQNALQELERLLGMEPAGQLRPNGPFPLRPHPFQLEQLVQRALENRPDLQAAVAEQRRVAAETALTRRLLVPNPTLQVFYRKEEGGQTIAGGTLRFPLPLFDRKQAELLQLAGRATQARHERHSTELRIRQEVRDAWRRYEAAREEVAVFETAVLERATENLQLVETAYRAGKIDLLQVVVVQNDLVQAQLSYIDALENYWLAYAALERAVGQDDLQP